MHLVTLFGSMDAGTVTALELVRAARQKGCERHTNVIASIEERQAQQVDATPFQVQFGPEEVQFSGIRRCADHREGNVTGGKEKTSWTNVCRQRMHISITLRI